MDFSKDFLDSLRDKIHDATGNAPETDAGQYEYDQDSFTFKDGWFSKTVRWDDVAAITAYVPDVGVYNTDFRLAFELKNGKKEYFDEKDKGFIFLLHKIKENLPIADISFIGIDRLVTPRGQFIVMARDTSSS